MSLSWNDFEYKNRNVTSEFENLCRNFFRWHYIKNKDAILPQIENNPGIEVAPYEISKDFFISFQAKYFTSKIKYEDILDSARKAVVNFKGKKGKIVFFCNKDINPATKSFEEAKRVLTNNNIEFELCCNHNLLDIIDTKYADIKMIYFNVKPEKYVQIVHKMLSEVGNGPTYFPTKFNTDELIRSTYYISPKFVENSEFDFSKDKHLIIGGPGSGKSLLLKRYYFKAAHDYLDKKSGPVPVYLDMRSWDQKKLLELFETDEKNFAKLDLIFYIDGLDENIDTTQKFYESVVFEKAVCISCRNTYFYLHRAELNYYKEHTIQEWTLDEAINFVDLYYIGSNLNENKANIKNIIKANNRVAASPLLISLLLFSARFDDCDIDSIDKNTKEIDAIIIKKALRLYVNREIGKHELNMEYEIAEEFICYCCWFFFKNKYYGEINSTKHILKQVESCGIKADKNFHALCSILLGGTETYAKLNIHESIFEYILALYVLKVYQEKIKNIDFLFMKVGPEVLHYLLALLKLEGANKIAFDWLIKCYNESKIDFSKNQNNLYTQLKFINLIMPIARIGKSDAKDFLVSEYNQCNSETMKLVFLDEMVQYLSLEDRLEYEEIYYKKLQDKHFAEINCGCRMDYTHCTKSHQNMLSGLNKDCPYNWFNLFISIKDHFNDDIIEKPHYTLRRIELFTIEYLLKYYEIPEFIDELKKFIWEIGYKIVKRNETDKYSKLYNAKVEKAYKSLLQVISA